MKIGIVGPFNPASIAEFLNEKEVMSINNMATAVNTLVKEMLIQGHVLKIFTTSSYSEYIVLRGKNVIVYIIPSGILPIIFGRHKFLIGNLFLPRRISKVIKKEIKDLDVLHSHWTYEYALAVSSYSKTIPVFDSVRDWCPYQLSITKGLKKLHWMMKYLMFKKVMSDIRITFIANSNYTYQMIKESYPEKDVPIISNPIDKKWIIEKKKNSAKHQIISIAQALCSPRKNITTLLKAFVEYKKSYPEARLHLVGRYDKNDVVYQRWKEYNLLEGVIFHGLLPHEELLKLIDEMTFLVHPAVEETFGNILLEAMARCVPCIGGVHAGAVPEVLGYGEYGVICDITDYISILKAMNQMNDLNVYNIVQKNATEMLRTKLSSTAIVERHIDLFQEKKNM